MLEVLALAGRDLPGPHGLRRRGGVHPPHRRLPGRLSVDSGGRQPRSRGAVDDYGHRGRPHALPVHAPRPVSPRRTCRRRARRSRGRRAGAPSSCATTIRARPFRIWRSEHQFLITYAQILCATALCDDDLHVQSVPLWEKVIEAIDRSTGDAARPTTICWSSAPRPMADSASKRDAGRSRTLAAACRSACRGARMAIGHRQNAAGARQRRPGWSGDPAETQRLVHQAYPAIAEGYRAHDVSRCWLYLGFIAIAVGELEDADERFGHAERHWREVEKPLHIHRILVQRSWVDILCNRFEAAAEKAAQARELLDSWPRRSWLQYARLDDHVGSILRAEALADPEHASDKFEQAADLKVPAALAVDSVRHAILDADARMRWARFCFGTGPRRRIRRRMGVGECGAPEPTRRISQCARCFQHGADGQRRR